MLTLCLWMACDDGGAWDRAQQLAFHAKATQGQQNYSHPLWVDTARECSRVMPWHPGYTQARDLRAAIEAGRLQALSP